jgi:ATP-dependent Clp protease ATP-binding subunit ClpA
LLFVHIMQVLTTILNQVCKSETLKVVDKNLKELQALLDEKGVTLQVSQPAREWLADKGNEPAFGARPMARLVEQQLKKPLADAILFGELKEGGTAKVEHKGDVLGITTKAK